MKKTVEEKILDWWNSISNSEKHHFFNLCICLFKEHLKNKRSFMYWRLCAIISQILIKLNVVDSFECNIRNVSRAFIAIPEFDQITNDFGAHKENVNWWGGDNHIVRLKVLKKLSNYYKWKK